MRKLILISLIFIISLVCVACNKDEKPIETSEGNYASNATAESTEENETNDNLTTIIESESETQETTTAFELYENKMLYNVEDDINKSEVVDFDTISVDGKLISMPCSYDYLHEKFGDFYTIVQSKYELSMQPIDVSSIGTSFIVNAKPTTGDGTIELYFYSTEPTTIDKMTCKGISVYGGNTTNEKLMTLALPNNITFGMSGPEIRDILGDSHKINSQNADNNDFCYQYFLDKYDIFIMGYDNGLYQFKITYK